MRHARALGVALATVVVLLLVGTTAAIARDHEASVPLCLIARSQGDRSSGSGPERNGTLVTALTAAKRTTVTDLRLTFGRLLAEHTFLTLDAMRATALRGSDLSAVSDALAANSTELGSLVRSVYGADGAAEFDRLWRDHVNALLAYASSVASGDSAGAEAARQALSTYLTNFARFLAAANPHLSAEHEAMALQLHVNQLLAFADADYERAFETGRDAYRHMFDMGDDLARGIAEQFPNRFTGTLVAFSPRGDLRLTLDRLLGEHLVLAAEAMRAGIQHSPDASDSSNALAANSADIAAVVTSLYDQSAGDAFGDLWERHIQAYLGYVDASSRNDATAREQSLVALRAYPAQIADFLASANPNIDRAAVEGLLGHHVEALINQTDAFAAGDYPRSIAVIREAYAHMFVVGDALSAAIAAQFPDRFKDVTDLPPTDTNPGTEAAPSGPGWLPLAAGLAAVTLGLLLSPRGRTRRRSRHAIPAADLPSADG